MSDEPKFSMHSQPRRHNPEESTFLSDVFRLADPAVTEFMERHNAALERNRALLERVTVLERAMEKTLDLLQRIEVGAATIVADVQLGREIPLLLPPIRQAQKITREALDA
jgi:hypothetical protein